MKVLVTGGRDFNNVQCVFRELAQLSPSRVIHGGASGADRLAGLWAEKHNVGVSVYPAKWDEHGKSAGPRRNQEMIDVEKPDVVLAFPGGRGTADCVRRAEAAGIRIVRATVQQSVATDPHEQCDLT